MVRNVLFLFILFWGSLSAQTLRMGADETTRMYYPVIEELLKEAGLETELVVLPTGRSLFDANSGYIDGEIWRVSSIKGEYTNLIPVPTPLRKVEFLVYYKPELGQLADLDDLEGKVFGIVRGVKAVELYLKEHKNKVIYTENPEVLFTLLESGRIDVAIANRNFQKRPNYDSDIAFIEEPLINETVHLWLNKKHSSLIPQIDEVLQNWGKSQLDEMFTFSQE
ncbi:MAG: transporter substrate-binding domain-containing protein [Spirochaetales bacterium]|nr:transporter substrate-binding domain-containing protein [Spirochaetales bacterium]